MKRRIFLKSVAATASTLAFPAIAIGQQYKAEYKMSTVVPPAFAWGKGGEIFANLVRERSSGRINIKQYPGASLVQGDQTRELSAMRQGIIDVLCGAPINWAGTARELGVFTLPFITPDHRALDAVLASREVMGEFFDLVRKAGAEPVGVEMWTSTLWRPWLNEVVQLRVEAGVLFPSNAFSTRLGDGAILASVLGGAVLAY